MEQRRVTPLTTAGCFAAIMLVFALLSTYVPIFSFIGYFIMPIPMVIIFMKYGLRQALLLGVTVGFLMGLFIDPVTALVQFLSFGAVGLTLGAGFRYEWSAVRLLGTVTAALVAVFVVITLLSYVVLDVNLFTQMNDFFTQFMDNMMAQYQQQGMSDVKLAETRAQLILGSDAGYCLAQYHRHESQSDCLLLHLYPGDCLCLLSPQPPFPFREWPSGPDPHLIFCHACFFVCCLFSRHLRHAHEL